MQRLFIFTSNKFGIYKKEIENIKPDVVVVDRIQAILHSKYDQFCRKRFSIRECCNFLMQMAKNEGITVIVIGHVTKEGRNIAGPKVLSIWLIL